MIQEVELKFENITLQDDTKISVMGIIEKMQWTAPSDSDLYFSIRREAELIFASCRIVSQAGTFMAEAMALDPVQALREVEENIRHQVQSWKAQRFESSRFNPIEVRA